jgi:hypothetical protein
MIKYHVSGIYQSILHKTNDAPKTKVLPIRDIVLVHCCMQNFRAGLIGKFIGIYPFIGLNTHDNP